MTIYDRNLKPGQTLVVASGKYEGRRCEVVAPDCLRLDDGQEFKSPSAAGTAVVDSGRVNGWDFWSVEGEAALTQAPRKTRSESKAEQRARDVAMLGEKTPRPQTTARPSGEHTDLSICVDCGKNVDGDDHWHDSRPHLTPEGLTPGTLCCACAEKRGYTCMEAARGRLVKTAGRGR